jgi:hypothetical protein
MWKFGILHAQPWFGSPGLCPLVSLLHISRSASPPWPPPRLLLNSQIPDVPGVGTVLAKNQFLIGGQIQAVADSHDRSLSLG